MTAAEALWREAASALLAACLRGAPPGVIAQYAKAMYALMNWK